MKIHHFFQDLTPERRRAMGASWHRPTVGDFVLVTGAQSRALGSRRLRWGQLFADDGEEAQRGSPS